VRALTALYHVGPLHCCSSQRDASQLHTERCGIRAATEGPLGSRTRPPIKPTGHLGSLFIHPKRCQVPKFALPGEEADRRALPQEVLRLQHRSGFGG
jgi:hypothetical protein